MVTQSTRGNNMKTIKEVLMQRDNMLEDDAIALIDEAKDAVQEYLENGEMESAEEVCMEYFGLEPDYLMELI